MAAAAPGSPRHATPAPSGCAPDASSNANAKPPRPATSHQSRRRCAATTTAEPAPSLIAPKPNTKAKGRGAGQSPFYFLLCLHDYLGPVAVQFVVVGATIGGIVLCDASVGAGEENVRLKQSGVVEAQQIGERRVVSLQLLALRQLAHALGDGVQRLRLFAQRVPVSLLLREVSSE